MYDCVSLFLLLFFFFYSIIYDNCYYLIILFFCSLWSELNESRKETKNSCSVACFVLCGCWSLLSHALCNIYGHIYCCIIVLYSMYVVYGCERLFIYTNILFLLLFLSLSLAILGRILFFFLLWYGDIMSLLLAAPLTLTLYRSLVRSHTRKTDRCDRCVAVAGQTKINWVQWFICIFYKLMQIAFETNVEGLLFIILMPFVFPRSIEWWTG